jgi:hypothetical protein
MLLFHSLGFLIKRITTTSIHLGDTRSLVDNIKTDLTEIWCEIVDCIQLAHGWVHWRAILMYFGLYKT